MRWSVVMGGTEHTVRERRDVIVLLHVLNSKKNMHTSLRPPICATRVLIVYSRLLVLHLPTIRKQRTAQLPNKQRQFTQKHIGGGLTERNPVPVRGTGWCAAIVCLILLKRATTVRYSLALILPGFSNSGLNGKVSVDSR